MTKFERLSPNIQKLIIDNPDIKNNLAWLNIVNPRKSEIEYLRKNYNFSLPHLQASSAMTMAQRPRIDKQDDYLFLILHFPVLDSDGDVVSGEIEFFVGKNYIITLHNNNIAGLNQLFNLFKKDESVILSYKSESSCVLLYEILLRLIHDSFDLLDTNSKTLIELEKLIFSSQPKKAVSTLLDVRRNVINTRKIMQNHKTIIQKLTEKETGLELKKESRKYYNELWQQAKRFWENLENQKEMVEVLNSTNESLLNYRLSDIMKTLTIFSVIVFPLTLLAAIFGMNTTQGMPFMDNENGFWIIIAIMLVGCLAMILLFSRKKWL